MAKKTSAANVTSAQLNSRLKKGELLPVYLLYGPEQGLLQAMAQRLMEAAVPKESQPMLLTRLEGDKLAVDPADCPLPYRAFSGRTPVRCGQRLCVGQIGESRRRGHETAAESPQPLYGVAAGLF